MDARIDLVAILLAIFLIGLSGWRPLRSARLVTVTPPAAPVHRQPLAYQDPAAGTLQAVRLALAAPAPAMPAPRQSAASQRLAHPAARAGRRRARASIGPWRDDRRVHRPWYQRRMIVAPVSGVLLLVTALSAGAWYATSQLASLDDLSTPPPEVSGLAIGAATDTVIDTRPAQDQVEQERELVGTPDTTPASPESLTVLVMGVDARPGQPIDIQVRADSLAVVHVDPGNGTCRMLSIPRDTRVPLPGYGFSKMNHALAIGGVPYQQLVVSKYLGVEIDHYGLIDFTGLVELVDAVGGVTVENREYAFEYSEKEFPVGTLHLSGKEALVYVGYRDGPDGDYGRQQRQQQVARALLDVGADLNLITAIPDLLGAVRGHIRTDTNGRGLVDLAQKYRSACTADSLETATLDGTVALDWDDLSSQELTFVHVQAAEVQQKVGWLLGNDDDATTTTDVLHHQGWTIDRTAGTARLAARHRTAGSARRFPAATRRLASPTSREVDRAQPPRGRRSRACQAIRQSVRPRSSP